MRVTLCVEALAPQPGGIGRYTWELCKGLSASAAIGQLHFYGRRRLIADPSALVEGRKLPRRRRVARPFHALHARSVLRSSLVHGPNYFLPPAANGGIVTIHDLSVFRFPETHPAQRVRTFERLFAKTLERAAHVITDSQSVRAELIADFGLAQGSVSVVPLGVDARFSPASRTTGQGAARWSLDQKGYALCVSTIEPRKKIAELLIAWERLPAGLRDRFPLVLAGGEGWENQIVRERITRGVEAGWLRHLGFVEDSYLPDLYAGARLFLYPSIYEGFGLPPLEAMASGVPVVASSSSCVSEICGDAARYGDPHDCVGFAELIEDCLGDENWIAKARGNAIERASGYSWSRCVAETIDVYRKVSSGG